MKKCLPRKTERLVALWQDEGFANAAQYGIRRMLQRAVWLLEDRIVWRRIGNRTRKTVAVAEMKIENTDRNFAYHYEATPTPLLTMWFIRRILPKDRSAWSFIDVGAGKGRAVAAAANQGYQNVLGIELASDLCAEANSLLNDLNLTGGGRVRVE